MKKTFIVILLMALPAAAQIINGGSGGGVSSSSQVTGVFSGTCNNTTWLRGDGACSASLGGAATADQFTEITAPTSPSAGFIWWWADSTDHRMHDLNSSGAEGTTVVSDTGAANNFLTAISASGVISKAQPSSSNLSDGTALVKNNAANTGTSAITMDLSAATTANAFKVPVGAGLTSGADGVIAYDTTGKNTHIRINAGDMVAVGESASGLITGGVIPKMGSSTTGQLAASSLTDTGSAVTSTEIYKFGAAGGNPNQDLTIGSTTSAMAQQTTATLTNVTGMTWTINASKNYRLRCEIPVTFVASATIQFALNGPGTPTSYSLVATGPIAASAGYGQFGTYAAAAWGTKTAVSGAPGAVTETIDIYGFIQNGTTASGTALTLQTSANGINGITVLANASCDLKQVN